MGGTIKLRTRPAMTDEERVLWTHGDAECVLISCCNGAELQLRMRLRPNAETSSGDGNEGRSARLQPDYEIVLRELYPTKSDLYERARLLESQMAGNDPATPESER